VRNFAGEPFSCSLDERDADGRLVERPDIEEVRLCWETEAADGGGFTEQCDRNRSEYFNCADKHGVTSFVIEQGRTALWIELACADRVRAWTRFYEVPAPIVRDVQDGAVATLNALLIVADGRACDPGAVPADAGSAGPDDRPTAGGLP